MRVYIEDEFTSVDIEREVIIASDVLQMAIDAMLGMGFQRESIHEAVIKYYYEHGLNDHVCNQ